MLSNYLYACFFVVFCNCLHAALSSTLLFLCACVCGTACAFFYMNFTIGSIDESLFGISCYVYSLESLYMTHCTMTKCCLSYMYICSFLFSVTVPMLLFLLFLLFPCRHARVVGGAHARA